MQNKNEAIFHKQFLLGKGFSFDVHTHYEIINNVEQFGLYNYVIIRLDQNNIKIIRNDRLYHNTVT